MKDQCATGDQELNDLANGIKFNSRDQAAIQYERILSQPGNVAGTSAKDIKKLDLEKAKIESEIATLKGVKGSATESVRRQKKSLLASKEAAITKAKINKDTHNEKMKLLKDLEKIILDQYKLYADNQFYQTQPIPSFTAVKDWARKQLRGEAFNTFDELDIGQLKALKFKLGMIYKKMNKEIANDDKHGWRSQQLYDPGAVLFEHDPTGLGYTTINNLKYMPDRIFSRSNIFNEKIDIQRDKFNDMIRYMSQQANLEKPQERLLFQEATAEAFEILDEQIMNFNPTPMFKWVEGKIVWLISDAQKAAIAKIYESNLDSHEGGNGLGARGDIKTTTINGISRIYIPIKQLREDNKEVYDVFELPFYLHESGVKKLHDPFNEEILEEFFEDGIRLAAYTSKDGKESTANMPSGYHKTLRKANDTANFDTSDEFIIRSYQDYMPYELQSVKNTKTGDNFSIDGEQYWNIISDLRTALLGVHQETAEEITQFNIDLKATVVNIYSEYKKTGKSLDLSRGFTKEVIQQMVKEVGNLQGLNANFGVKGKGANTEIIGANMFNQRINYMPHQYYDGDYIKSQLENIDKIKEKIKSDIKRHEGFKAAGKDLLAKTTATKISNSREDIQDTLQSIEIKLGKVDVNEIDLTDDDGQINTVKNSRHSKTRAGAMNPITVKNSDGIITNRGIKKTWDVFSDYGRNVYTDLEQKKIILQTMNALIHTNAQTANYLVDHVKSGLGDPNTNAGFAGVDYSDSRLKKAAEAILNSLPGVNGKKVSMKGIQAFVSANSAAISASLLRVGAPLTNNFQVFNLAMKSGWEKSWETWRLWKDDGNRKIIEKAAQRAGVTDTIVALADALTQLTGDEMMWGGDAFVDLALIKMNKRDFLNKFEDSGWGSWIQNRFEKMDEETKANFGDSKDVAGGLWDMLDNITNEEWNGNIKKEIAKHLDGLISKKQLQKYTSHALKGGVWSHHPKTKAIMSMVGTETFVRTMGFLDGALNAWDYMDQSRYNDRLDKDQTWLEWLLEQPEAVENGRVTVQLTMFGISPAFLSPMFKGSIGKVLTKFKPFVWHQVREEWKYFENFMAQHSEHDDSAVKKILKSTYESAKLTMWKGLPFRDISKLTKPEQQFRNLLLYRGLVSVLASIIQHNAPGSAVLKAIFMKGGNRTTSNALFRGGESAIISMLIQSTMTLGMLSGIFDHGEDDEKYDEVMDSFMWMFSPMIVNMIYQALKAEDGWEAASGTARVYFQPIFWVGDSAMAIIDEVEEYFD